MRLYGLAAVAAPVYNDPAPAFAPSLATSPGPFITTDPCQSLIHGGVTTDSNGNTIQCPDQSFNAAAALQACADQGLYLDPASGLCVSQSAAATPQTQSGNTGLYWGLGVAALLLFLMNR